MAREVIESAKIVIKTEDGNRLAIQGKGSAPRVMLTAFTVLSQKRREWLMKHMAAEHAKILAREEQINGAGAPVGDPAGESAQCAGPALREITTADQK
jgi:hypothetical protein